MDPFKGDVFSLKQFLGVAPGGSLKTCRVQLASQTSQTVREISCLEFSHQKNKMNKNDMNLFLNLGN